MSRRPSFLAIFFTVLAVAFTIVLVARIRSYRSAGAPDRAIAVDDRVEPAAGVVDDAQAGGGANVSLTEAARAREEKLQAALREPLPPGAPPRSAARTAGQVSPDVRQVPQAPPPPREPTLLQKVGGAMSSIFGGGGARPAAITPPAQENRKREPSDAESDVQPPQLHALDFTPPQIRDGEFTVLSVIAGDDLSGVASVSGVIASPSGSVQGFAASREGETNRYTARIQVPADAPEGIWRVNYLSLSDHARNNVSLTAAQGRLPATASFRVTSARSDSSPPTLKAVWLEQLVMKVGEPNRLFVQAEDDKSGLSAVTGVFVSPQKTARVSFGCTVRPDATWECAVIPPRCLDCGRWQLEQLQLHDKANNMAVLRSDQPLVSAVQLDITGEQCNAGAPHLSSIVLNPNVVSNAEANTIVVAATLTDSTCGVASVSGNAVGPASAGSPRIYFTFSRGAGGEWTALLSVPKHAASGTWRISTIQVIDRGQNLKLYSESDPVLRGVVFAVQ